jgi:hypothetical protein
MWLSTCLSIFVTCDTLCLVCYQPLWRVTCDHLFLVCYQPLWRMTCDTLCLVCLYVSAQKTRHCFISILLARGRVGSDALILIAYWHCCVGSDALLCGQCCHCCWAVMHWVRAVLSLLCGQWCTDPHRLLELLTGIAYWDCLLRLLTGITGTGPHRLLGLHILDN